MLIKRQLKKMKNLIKVYNVIWGQVGQERQLFSLLPYMRSLESKYVSLLSCCPHKVYNEYIRKNEKGVGLNDLWFLL